MNKRIAITSFLTVSLISLLFLPGLASAQESRGLTISPLTFELTADPGDAFTNEIRVFNPSSSTFSVQMEVEDFTPVGEEGQVLVGAQEDETYSLKRWVTFEPASFAVEPGEKQFVRFTIAVPENAEPGGHYGSILASTVGAVGEGTTGTGVGFKVGALALLSVSGVVKEAIAVEEFSAPDFLEQGPVPFDIRFANTGTVHVRPIGFVHVTNLFGKTTDDVPFPQRNVIPGSKRHVELAWSPKGFTVGKYTASLIGSYGVTNTPFSSITTFWIVPWKALLLWGVVLLALLFVLYLAKRRVGLALSILVRGERQ